jgi:HSP20 family molecular chaperone IbpA
MQTVTSYRPVSIDKAMRDFDLYMESFLGEGPLAATRLFNRFPVVDIRETDSAYVLEAELPGYDEKGLEVNVDNRTLTIASKKEEKAEKQEDRYLLRERQTVSFRRAFKLPEDADPALISATFKKGILALEIQKQSGARRRTIEINTRDAG